MQPANKSAQILDGFFVPFEGRDIPLREIAAAKSGKYTSLPIFSGKNVPEKVITQFLMDNETQLNVILSLFNEAQTQSSFGLSHQQAEDLKKEKKTLKKLARILAKAPGGNHSQILQFQENMQKISEGVFLSKFPRKNQFIDPVSHLQDMKISLKEDEAVHEFWEIIEQVLDKKEAGTFKGLTDAEIKNLIWLGLEKLPNTNFNDSTLMCLQWLILQMMSSMKVPDGFSVTMPELLTKMLDRGIFSSLAVIGSAKREASGKLTILNELLGWPISQELYMQMKDIINSKDYEIYAKLQCLLCGDRRIPHIPIAEFSEMDKNLSILELKKAPLVDRYKREWTSLQETMSKTARWAEALSEGRLEDRQWADHELDDLVTVSAILGKWEWIESIKIAKLSLVDELKFKRVLGFLCDKLVPYEWDKLMASFEVLTTNTMIRMLQQLDRRTELKPFVVSLQNKLLPLLKECVLFSEMKPTQSLIKIKYRLQEMKKGERFLLYLGCAGLSVGHCTLLLVEKDDQAHFSLTHYNTGLAVADWHFRWKETNRYQTYSKIIDVPLASLSKIKLWEKLFDARKGSQMAGVYQALEKLSAGGKKEAASLDKEDYDKRQNSGSCASQCLMSFFKHQCMEEAARQGLTTPAEKEAVYKIMKTELFTHSKDIKTISKALNEKVPTRMQKLGAEWSLTELAEGKASFKKAYKTLSRELQRQPESIANHIFARYAALKRCSLELVELWIKNPPLKKLNHPAFAFANAVYQHKLAAINNWNVKLEREQDSDKKSQLLYAILQYTSHRQLGVEKVAEFFLNSKEKYHITNFLNRLAQDKATLPIIIEEIVQQIQLKGNKKLAHFIAEYWRG